MLNKSRAKSFCLAIPFYTCFDGLNSLRTQFTQFADGNTKSQYDNTNQKANGQ